MPVLVNYNQPIFWTPANAIGSAVSVHGERNDKPIVINFYWSGVLLATRPEGSRQLTLDSEVSDFLKSFIPTNESEPIMHFQRVGDGFRKIVDPKWVPGVRV
jgi:hypothetical protein